MNRWQAEYIFRKFHTGTSESALGHELNRSNLTIRKVLTGEEPYGEKFADIRARFPEYKTPRELSDGDLRDIFVGYHNDNRTLADLGRQYGLQYYNVARILRGELHGDRTADLRAAFPAYKWNRDDISFDDDQLVDIFVGYHERIESLDTVAARYHARPGTISKLLKGKAGARHTEKLRAKYGNEIRSRGRGGWPSHVRVSAQTG